MDYLQKFKAVVLKNGIDRKYHYYTVLRLIELLEEKIQQVNEADQR